MPSMLLNLIASVRNTFGFKKYDKINNVLKIQTIMRVFKPSLEKRREICHKKQQHGGISRERISTMLEIIWVTNKVVVPCCDVAIILVNTF
jgi:hypothetical protein